MPRHDPLLIAAMLAVLPLAGCAPFSPQGPVATACPTDPSAGTQTAQRELGAAQQANSALNQARYGFGGGAGIGGLIGAAQSLLGAAQQVQIAQQPAPSYCRPAPK